MTGYQGNGAYCYANAASMLLSTIGANIPPSLLEVLTGFSLGAAIEIDNHLLYFDNGTSSPDQGINNAFQCLGFEVLEKVCLDGQPIPLDALKDDLAKSPVMLGPLDMGYLTYNPNYRFLGGADHYVLALGHHDDGILLHDPAGFPFATLSFEQLEPAWRADTITWSAGSFRSWTSPIRISHPTSEEIYHQAIESFKLSYRDQHVMAVKEKRIVGKAAIQWKVKQVKSGDISEEDIGHFIHFAFPLGARRALDYAYFFKERNEQLALLKRQQAQLFGQCHTFAMSANWDRVAESLEQLAGVESNIESAILSL